MARSRRQRVREVLYEMGRVLRRWLVGQALISISAVTAILVAFAKRPKLGLGVALLFLVILSLEGYVLAPRIQRRAVYLPPAVILFTQVPMGVMVGALGDKSVSP